MGILTLFSQFSTEKKTWDEISNSRVFHVFFSSLFSITSIITRLELIGILHKIFQKQIFKPLNRWRWNISRFRSGHESDPSRSSIFKRVVFFLARDLIFWKWNEIRKKTSNFHFLFFLMTAEKNLFSVFSAFVDVASENENLV
jgi:hypothetical protein